MSNSSKTYWRSLGDLREGDRTDPKRAREFADDHPDQLELGGVDRRGFLGIMGAASALAGATLVPGCIRKPQEGIFPYAKRPEEMIPGKPRQYRTAFNVGDAVLGLQVESQDGRPTKVEGNPDHPMNVGGGASTWAQASVLDLYDPERSRKPVQKGKETTWDALWADFAKELQGFAGTGTGLAVLVDGKPSPTRARLLAELKTAMPQVGIYRWDPALAQACIDGLGLVGLADHAVSYDLSKAKVVVSLDADFLGTEGDSVRNARLFADGRRVAQPGEPMNRLYSAEPVFSLTGMMADNRLRLPASHIGELARGIAGRLAPTDAPDGIRRQVVDRENTEPGGLAWSAPFKKFVEVVAADLAANRGASVVVAGVRQPAWVHGLAAWINDALGNTGKTVFYAKRPMAAAGTLAELGQAISANKVDTLVILGGNPVYDAPADLRFGELLGRVRLVVHHGQTLDETGQKATWHVPASHYLEAWGDLIASDGTVTVQQPLIAPLFGSVGELELLSRILGQPVEDASTLVRATVIGGEGLAADNAWRRGVHDGVIVKGQPGPAAISPDALVAAMTGAKGPGRPSPGALDVEFVRDPSVLDGRFANNGWLQELPDTLSKLTWDNAALVSAATGKELGVQFGETIQLTVGGASVTLAAAVVPGVADNVVVLPLGYGRKIGRVATGAGFDVYPLRRSDALWFAENAQARVTGEKYVLASTQDQGTMVEPITGNKRPVVREGTAEGYAKDPSFIEHAELMEKDKIVSYWVPPNATDGQQWAMVIDLNTCTGCNACTVACQAENNIPVVGKARVLEGREMHWIRVDRYFSGSEDMPEAVVQPIPCMQCEMAPCESVCPVAATTHSPEGLNDMAYNRCIGTRYCSNNCPFKVRRFNFFNYNKLAEAASPTYGLQKNPDVTVRFRGVMEKCTYCVQRINEAKIAAKRDSDGVVKDGAIVPACAQTCPAGAITFGDKNDPTSAVSRMRAQPRNYELLRELNLHARTTFLAKLRNPNPDLVNNGSAG